MKFKIQERDGSSVAIDMTPTTKREKRLFRGLRYAAHYLPKVTINGTTCESTGDALKIRCTGLPHGGRTRGLRLRIQAITQAITAR